VTVPSYPRHRTQGRVSEKRESVPGPLSPVSDVEGDGLPPSSHAETADSWNLVHFLHKLLRQHIAVIIPARVCGGGYLTRSGFILAGRDCLA
jgi:hypothetical protein